MIELVIVALFFVILALVLMYRVIAGPTMADRIMAGDALDVLVTVALALYAVYTGRGIFLDIAIITALFGFIGTVFAARYLEGRL